MTKIIMFMGLVSPAFSYADFNLAHNGKEVVCYAEDNQSWVLNAERTTIKYTVEGESLGELPIFDVDTDGDTSVSYSTEEGTLTLADEADTYQFAEEDRAGLIRCKE